MNIVLAPAYVADDEIEQRALKLLADFQREEHVRLNAPPVPIHRIVESHLELRLLYDEIGQDAGEKILAYIDPFERVICLNTLHQHLFDKIIGPEAFTLAHEAGHWELHVIKDGWRQLSLNLADNGSGERFLCRAKRNDPREYQANRFAAALLMPKYLVMKAIRDEPITRWETLNRLAKEFEVSKQAFRIRLENLNVIRVNEGNIELANQPHGGRSTFW